MSSQKILKSLFWVPLIIITKTAESSFLMNVLDSFKVSTILDFSLFRMRNEECIMSISGWMSLRLKQGIEIPEGTLNIAISLHFFESHF